MIRIRNNDKPIFLDSATIEECRGRVRARAGAGESPAIMKADEKWRDDRITDVLYEGHFAKCCYCERKRDRKREMDVEHYRPKGEVEEDVEHSGYWWQAYEWDNLLWSCKTCNQKYKYMKFPLLPEGIRAAEEGDDLSLERPCLINPKLENPFDFISFNIQKVGGRCFVSATPLAGISLDDKKRALDTIFIVGLNREEKGYNLVQERGDEFSGSFFETIVVSILSAEHAKLSVPANRDDYESTINELREQLKRFIHPSRVFSGIFRDSLRHKEIPFDDLLPGI